MGSVKASTEAQDRYELGSLPITDTHEARARLAGLRAHHGDYFAALRRSQLASLGAGAKSIELKTLLEEIVSVSHGKVEMGRDYDDERQPSEGSSSGRMATQPSASPSASRARGRWNRSPKTIPARAPTPPRAPAQAAF